METALVQIEQLPSDVDNGTDPCGGCGKPFPREELQYPDLCFGKRKLLCSECRKQARGDAIQKLRAQSLDQHAERKTEFSAQRVQRFVGLATANGESPAPTIHRALNALMEEAGGIEAFVSGWWAHVEATKPGSQVALNAYRDIAKLLATATARTEMSVDLSTKTEDELADIERAAIMRDAILAVMESCPDAAPYIEQWLLEHDDNGSGDQAAS